MTEIQEQLTKYLTDAHSNEEQALAQLRTAPDLAGVAERAGEQEVAGAADEIAQEERAMMNRLESNFDRAVDAALREVQPDDLGEQLRKYLSDAHAIEEQAIALLERGPKLAGSGTLAAIYSEHLEETRGHA